MTLLAKADAELDVGPGAGEASVAASANALALSSVGLDDLMQLGEGRRDVRIALVDGPVAMDRPAFGEARVERISGPAAPGTGPACAHGTFVAAILVAARSSPAPGVCPGCTLLVRPILGDTAPETTPDALADALLDSLDAGAHVINLSVAIARPTLRRETRLEAALDLAARRHVVVIAAAGNDGVLGGSVITRHPWVLPVVAWDPDPGAVARSNLSAAAGRRGLGAPSRVTSLGLDGERATRTGTSFAAALVSGTVALLLSVAPAAPPAAVRAALMRSGGARRRSVVPPLLDGVAAYEALRGHATSEGGQG